MFLQLERGFTSKVGTWELLRRIQNDKADLTCVIAQQNRNQTEGVEDDVADFGRAIGNNTKLRRVELSDYFYDLEEAESWESLWMKRWRAFFNGGFVKNRSIEEISLNRISHENMHGVLGFLGPFLANNPSLRKIHYFSLEEEIDVHEFELLAMFLLKRGCPLDVLHLEVGQHDDFGILRAFARAFRGSERVIPKRFHLEFIYGIGVGVEEMECVAQLLTKSGCTMEELELPVDDDDDHDEIAELFSSALAENKTMRKLDLFFHSSTMTITGWKEFSSLICDNSSLNATYGSNHTLSSLGSGIDEMSCPAPDDLISNLELNENGNKQFVARKKVFIVHFLVGNAWFPLIESMNSTLLVQVVEFMNKIVKENGDDEDTTRVGKNICNTLLFMLVKSHPTQTNTAKRRRV